MTSIFHEVFANKNVLVTSVTSLFYRTFNQLWQLWWSLYLLELGAPILMIGFVSTLNDLSRVLLQLPGGMLADKYGRRKVILAGTVIRTIAPLIMFFARTWQHVVPGMLLNTASIFYMPALNATISESLPFERRGAAFGVYRTITSSPQIFMPIISGIYIAQLGIVDGVRLGFILYEFACIAAFLIRFRYLRETLSAQEPQARQTAIESQDPRETASIISSMRQSLFGSRTVLTMIVVATISGFTSRMVYPFLTIYVVNEVGLDTTQWGLLQSIFAAVSTPLFILGGVLSDKIGRVPCIMLARSIAPIEYFGILVTSSFPALLGLFTLLGVGGGLGGGGLRGGGYQGGPAWQALIADTVPSENRGKVMGMMALVSGIASLPAAIIGGYVWDSINPNTLLTVGLVLGVSVIPTMALFLRAPKTRRQ